MKSALLAAVLSMSTFPAVAGGMSAPIVEPEVIVEDAGSSGGDNWAGILLLLAVVGAIASN